MPRKIISKNRFFVYLHKCADTGTVFYVGKGSLRRDGQIACRSDFWKNVANRHGVVVERYAENLSESESYELEIKLIKKYGRRNNGTGSLVNMTDGGEGVSGDSVSGKNNHNYNHAIYTWIRRDGVTEKLTQQEFAKKYDFTSGSISNLMDGSSLSYKGWYLNEIKERTWSGGSSPGKSNPNADLKEYRFVRRDGQEVVSIRQDFISNYDVTKSGVDSLIRGHALQHKGWYLKTIKEKKIGDKRFLRRGENHPRFDSTDYTWVKGDITEVSTKLAFRERHGFESTKVSALVNGKRKTHKGWRVA